MNEQFSNLEKELQQYILDHGFKGEQILGMELMATQSKTKGVFKSVCGTSLILLSLILSVVAIFFQFYLTELILSLCVFLLLVAFKLRVGGLLYGDYPATYFVVTTHGIYLCTGLHCCFVYSWSFDELTMLEYGRGKVQATSKYLMSEARKKSNNKALKALYKQNLKNIRKNKPIERRIFSFSDTFVRPPESMPGGSPTRSEFRALLSTNRPYHACRLPNHSPDARKIQTYTLKFSSDSEMPELCRKAASQYRKLKIERI